MPNSQTESIISVDMNFANGGGAHSASVTTVLDAKDLGTNNSLGVLVGFKGERTDFSNERLSNLFRQFINIETTQQSDGRKTTISRKYQDRTSLLLKSHCVLVRGKDAPLTGGKEFLGVVPYFGEVSNSPVSNKLKFPYRQPEKIGGVLVIGQIYNEESSADEASGNKVSLIYQGGELKTELSYNDEYVSNFYKQYPDLAKYNLLFGYTVSEFKKALSMIGLKINSIPDRDDILFETSGTLESILSDIATKFGYYWYIDPFSGNIEFINSTLAASKDIINPLDQPDEVKVNYLNASYTENELKPIIVNSFASTIEKQEQTFEMGDRQRITRFKICDILSKYSGSLKISANLLSVFYGAYCASNFSQKVFDAITFFDLVKTKYAEWGDNYPNIPELTQEDVKSLLEVQSSQTKLESELKLFDGSIDLRNALFIEYNKFGSKKSKKPSELPAFELIKSIFELLNNTVYISNKFYQWKARRMQFGSSDMNISGPFKLDKSIKDIDGLQNINTILKRIGIKDDITVGNLANFAGSNGTGDYVFIGICPFNQKITNKADANEDEDYDLFNEDNFIFWSNYIKDNYAVYSPKLFGNIEALINSSRKLFKDRLDEDGPSSTMRATFTRAKRPLDEEETDKTKKQEEADAERQANLDEAAEKLSEIYEKFDIKYFKLFTNGSNGSPLNPISLNIKNGKISEIQALEKYSFSADFSKAKSLKTSSRTIVGLELPTIYDITLSSISIQLNGDGVSTTITESTSRLLPLDDSLVIDAGLKAQLLSSISSRMTAAQRNMLKL